MKAKIVLVTGVSGLVGKAIVASLMANSKFQVVRCLRSKESAHTYVGDRYFDLSEPMTVPPMEDVNVVIHSAARVHIMKEVEGDAVAEFRRANVDATLALAIHARDCGVARFIYISSVKVNGESTTPGQAFKADDTPSPQDAYGRSKYEAEQGLLRLAACCDMEVVIIRPPLIFGPGVKANFLSMMRWVRRGVPLPFGAIHNQRSMVYLDNLVDLVLRCISHPAAANQIFLVSDPEPISTTLLLTMIANVMGLQPRLIPVPILLLQFAAGAIGMQTIVQRLTGSLLVDIEKNRVLLDWTPPVQTIDGLRATVNHFTGQPISC